MSAAHAVDALCETVVDFQSLDGRICARLRMCPEETLDLARAAHSDDWDVGSHYSGQLCCPLVNSNQLLDIIPEPFPSYALGVGVSRGVSYHVPNVLALHVSINREFQGFRDKVRILETD